MKNADEKLTALWKRARKAPRATPADAGPLALGVATRIATRIAARWAAGAERATSLALFERITACCLVPVLIILSVITWLHPAPAAPDLMTALFSARIEIANDFPF